MGMEKANEYRRRADECRVLAQTAPNDEIRSHYEQLAKIWDQLALERGRYLAGGS